MNREAIEALEHQASALIRKSVAPSTEKKYLGCSEKFREFCHNISINPFPPSEHSLILFATSLSKSMSHKNISAHIAAVKYHSQVIGYDLDCTSFSRLYRLLRGIKRTQGKKFRKPPRIPVTPSLLLTMGRNLWNSSYHFLDKAMLWAAMLTAFYGFLRVSEYTSPLVRYYDPLTTLCYQDITIMSHSQISIHIKASKTDPFRSGVQIHILANASPLCPFQALLKFLSMHPTKSGPLFIWNDGRFLTRSGLATAINRIKPCHIKNMSSHSFRIGAASTAAAAGHPRWLIQALGRWSSNCYRDYIRVPSSTLSQVSSSLAFLTSATYPTFDPDNIE